MPGIMELHSEGHLRGGPLCFGALLALLAGCAGGRGPERPTPVETAGFSRPQEVYRQMGLLAGPAQFAAVVNFSTLAGPADSTFVLVGVSLPNSAFRFQRDAAGFMAEYTIAAAFVQDSQQVKRLARRESVRVPSFAETGRTDESVVFQDFVALAPGRYEVRLQVADANSSRGFRATDTLDVPTYGPHGRSVSGPMLVYRARGRADRAQAPDLIVNPRNTVPYGGEAPHLYLESYGPSDTVYLRVHDDAGVQIWAAKALLTQGTDSLHYGRVDLPGETFPLGRVSVEVVSTDATTPPTRIPLVMSISDQWMVANFDEVLEFLRFIATPEEIDSLAHATPVERRTRWENFWARRDPIPATPVNEYREAFFQRVRFATENFGESGGLPGWQTDRGEVYIVLGPPDHTIDRYIGITENVGRPNGIEWIYEAAPGGRLDLLFLDRNGFGRFELEPSSRAAFRTAAERLKPREAKKQS